MRVRTYRRIVALLLFALLSHTGFAGSIPPSLIYQQITNEAGLSNSSINCIYQDSSGLMWFGTWDGLNIYNGTSFRVYKPESKNNKSISNNIIRSIVEERKGVLWIATDDGINRFDGATKTFTRFYFHGNERSTHREKPYLLARSRNQVMFCAVYELGLSYYNAAKGEFIALQIPGVNTFRIRNLFFDESNSLWLLLQSGELYKVDVSADNEGRLQVTDSRKMNTGRLLNIFPDQRNKAWVLHAESTISQLDCKTGDLQPFSTAVALPAATAITSVTTYRDQLLVARATGGVSMARIEGTQLLWTETLFPSQGIFSIYKGSQDILWVGSDGQGVYKTYPDHKKFYRNSETEIPGIMNSPIRCFEEQSEGIIYAGTKGSGLFRLDYRSGQPGNTGAKPAVQRIYTGYLLKNDAVYALHYSKGFLWIGTDAKGIQVLHTATGRMQNLAPAAGTAADFGSVYAICETSDSTLWLGTSGHGLIRLKLHYNGSSVVVDEYRQYSFDKAKEKWLSSNIIYALYADSSNQSLWIGTRGGGLNRLDLLTGNFEVYQVSANENSISSNDILSITSDRKGLMWIGTSNGVNSFQYVPGTNTQDFTSYFDVNGLPNNTIHGVVADEQNNLWISTNNGLSKLIQDESRFINYTKGDGLQSNEFADGAYYRSRFDGRLYFGGVEGFNSFLPSEIVTSNFEPTVYLNFLKLYNKTEVPVNGAISLSYDQNFFSVDFSSLEYINSEKCEYAYMLENFNGDWIHTGTTHTADFTNVPPGNYLLKIKATNSDRLWSSEVYSLPIHIGLPWWRTGWAYGMYVLLGLGLLYLVYHFLKLRIRDHQSLWKERLNRKKEDEIHEAKLRFFTNIAHEFFTPLTLIYGPCEKINEHKFSDSYVRRHTQIIKSNAERMLALIQQLMEFRKTESELPPLYLEDVDIPEMMKYISDSFSETIDRQQIRYTIKREEDALYWRTDRSSLEKIVYNLVSNAFKYTPDKGEVTIDIHREETHLIIKVTNTGKGIRQEDIEKLFNRFRVLDNPEKQLNGGMNIRTGLGLWLTKSLVNQLGGTITAESVDGKYTRFIVSVPAGSRTAYQDIREAGTTDGRPAISNTASSFALESKTIFPVPDTNGDGDMPRVLVVEDDRDIRDFLSSVLADQYLVVTAASANEAFEVMKDRLPQLIISDVLMDGMNGFEFTRAIKSNIVTRHIPVILLTGKRTVEDQVKGLSEGADVYLPKPFYPAHLKAVAARLLESRQELKEFYSSSASATEMYDGATLNREDYEFMIKTTRLIEQNLEHSELSPAFLFSELAMSKMQFYRKIREVAEQTPSEFIRTVRLKYAARQITTSSKTVQEIMFASGFNNKAYFFREFNKMFGVPPGEYRNAMREKT